MYRAIVLLMFSAPTWSHPGHGAPGGHLHGAGWEHALWALAAVAALSLALWRCK